MRKQKNKRKPKPTRVRLALSEDRVRDEMAEKISNRPRRRAIRELGPRMAETPAVAIDRSEVETRVMRALKTLRALPDRTRRMQGTNNGWPPYVQDAIDAYNSVESAERFQPSPRDISDYLTALAWCRHLPRNEWKLLWFRSFGLSFGLIADYIGRSDETARRRYEVVLTDVWCAANNIQSKQPTRMVGRWQRWVMAG